jgi:hypothetical protein
MLLFKTSKTSIGKSWSRTRLAAGGLSLAYGVRDSRSRMLNWQKFVSGFSFPDLIILNAKHKDRKMSENIKAAQIKNMLDNLEKNGKVCAKMYRASNGVLYSAMISHERAFVVSDFDPRMTREIMSRLDIGRRYASHVDFDSDEKWCERLEHWLANISDKIEYEWEIHCKAVHFHNEIVRILERR